MLRAVVATLWKVHRSGDDKDFLEKPESKPDSSQFRTKADPPQTRSSHASPFTTTLAPELVMNEQAPSAEHLTTQATIQSHRPIFQYDAKQYEIQRAAIKELKPWILKTVTESSNCTSSPQGNFRV
jgi:hypothetical protein